MAPDKSNKPHIRSIFDEPYDPPDWTKGKRYEKRVATVEQEDAIGSIMKEFFRSGPR